MSGLGIRLQARMRAAGLTHLVTVANGEGFGLYEAFKKDAETTVVDACREGEAVAICSGLYLGGKLPVLSMENFGLFECLDTLRAFPIALRIPMLLVVGYTAHAALTPEGEKAMQERFRNIAPQAILAAQWTEPMLKLVGIPFWYLAPTDDGSAFDEALAWTVREGRPAALLVDLT